MKRKKKVLFVGSFKNGSETGHVGGQMFACTSLINSSLNDEIDWVKIDTTASTNKHRSKVERSIGAAKRIVFFLFAMLFRNIDSVLIFCSRGASFREKGLMIRLAKNFGKKTILAPRSGLLIDDFDKSSGFKNFGQKVFDACDIIICQGRFWERYFNTQFSGLTEKTVVVHNWIKKRDNEKVIKSGKRMKIVFLGWIDQNKGVFDLINVAYELRSLDIEWHLAGNGKDYEEVAQMVSTYKMEEYFKLLGWVHGDEKDKLLVSSDVFILPSYREGLPNSMLEAMMYSLCTIVSDVGAVSDIIEDTVNGYLIEPGNVDSIKSAVRSAIKLGNGRKDMGNLARATVLEKNTIELAVEKFGQVLDINNGNTDEIDYLKC